MPPSSLPTRAPPSPARSSWRCSTRPTRSEGCGRFGPMSRIDGRADDQLRPVTFERDYTEFAAGSVLVTFGKTRVLCTASVDDDIPRWLKGSGKGWVTAEYSMLPGSSPERVNR